MCLGTSGAPVHAQKTPRASADLRPPTPSFLSQARNASSGVGNGVPPGEYVSTARISTTPFGDTSISTATGSPVYGFLMDWNVGPWHL